MGKIHLYFIVLPVHLMLILSLYAFGLSFYAAIIGLFLWVIIGGIGVEIGLHRIISHKQFLVSKSQERLLCLIGSLGLNGSPLFWRALHIGYHHPHPDSHRDFHSPKNGGKINSYILYMLKLDKLRFVGCKQLLDDKFHVLLNKWYNLYVYLAIGAAFIISQELLIALLIAMILSYHQTALVNTFCHDNKYGYKNFAEDSVASNIKWLSYLTFGLALHNNHHNKPLNANYSFKKGEVDLGFWLAKALKLKEVKHDI